MEKYKPTAKSKRIAAKHFYAREATHDIDYPGVESAWDYSFDFCLTGLRERIEAAVSAKFPESSIAWGGNVVMALPTDNVIVTNKKVAEFIVDTFYDELLTHSWRFTERGNLPLIAYWAVYDPQAFARYTALTRVRQTRKLAA